MLEVRDLTLKIDGLEAEAVSGVSLTVRAGECFALVGESGCGKSLTALSVLRLLPEGVSVASGRILLDGVDLLALREKDMRAVRGAKAAMIFQEPATSLNPVLTVGEQIVEAVRLHRSVSKAEARAVALKWLERVGIDAPERRIDAFAHELSGGQKQRVMIAMALACAPDVVVADEPTTALDVTLQAQILELLKKLQAEEGIALLLITHDLAVVRRYADRVALMYAGQIVEERSAADFFAAPAHPYAGQLLAAAPSAAKAGRALSGIAGTVPELSAMPAGCRYAPRCPLAQESCCTAPVAMRVLSQDAAGRAESVRCLRAGQRVEMPEEPLRKKGAVGRRVLEIRNLTVEYVKSRGLFRAPDVFKAVSGVNLDLAAGETLALVGESGSGKTTLAKAVLGLLGTADEVRVSGSVKIDGRGAYDAKGRFVGTLRRFAQIVFQDPFASLDPRMTVGECIAEGIESLHPEVEVPERAARVAKLLKRVGLSESAAHRLPHEFSGGQRQRIAIARALAVEPQIIVCDEPTSALDVSVQAQVLNLLARIQIDTGVAILLITHNFAVVEYAADRVAVMQKGRLLEAGPAEEVLLAPKTEYTRKLLASVPRLQSAF